MFDKDDPWGLDTSDPSVSLSTFSYERMRDTSFEDNVTLYSENAVSSIELVDGFYVLNPKMARYSGPKHSLFWPADLLAARLLCRGCSRRGKTDSPSLTKETSRPRSRECTFVAPLSAMTTMIFASYSSSGSALQSWRRV